MWDKDWTNKKLDNKERLFPVTTQQEDTDGRDHTYYVFCLVESGIMSSQIDRWLKPVVVSNTFERQLAVSSERFD